MQNYSKVLLSLVFFGALLFPNLSLATSGACSAHGGVNCAVGAGSLGNAVCNDGWQSSTNFYSTDECQVSCIRPTGLRDCDPNLKGAIVGQQYMYGTAGTVWSQEQISACDETHAQYQAAWSTYNSCLSTSAATQQQSLQNQTQLLVNSKKQAQDEVCQNAHGIYAQYDSTKNVCACQSGYETDPINSTCELPAAAAKNRAIACTNALGPNGYLKSFTVGLTTQTQCVCRDGFAPGTSGKCVDMRPTRDITQKALDFAKTNQNCKNDPSLSQDEIDQCFTYESNPDSISWQIVAPQSPTCPINSSLNATGSCTCNAGLYTGLGDDANKCIPRVQLMQEIGVSWYGPQAHYNATTTNYECNAGYIFENGSDPKNNKCILLSDWNAKNKTTDRTGISSTTQVTPQKQIQVSNTKILGLVKNTSTLAASSTATTSSYGRNASETKALTNTGVSAQKQKHWYEWLNPLNWFK